MKKYQKANKSKLVKKDIPLDTEVIIVNNTFGQFFYTSEKLENDIDFTELTSFEKLTLQNLKDMRRDKKVIFSEYSILIVDVLDDEYSLKDVYAYLDLIELYDELLFMVKSEDKFDVGMFEKFAVDCSIQELKTVISKMSKEGKTRLFQALSQAYMARAITLSKHSTYNKMTFMGNVLNEEDVLGDLDYLKTGIGAPSLDIRELL
ncbi:hypothetical protein [Bacillus wiedmannii]|uniref:hypothetical protein n=1 Tax=Bacillus wiedmannii TaxID=1890302 RepID=UPI000D08D822|nr:hypothetical protein [Bacillus wiedmannii]PRT14361.1 hypothetical protein C6360_29370 [Bacillus wiedmannii]